LPGSERPKGYPYVFIVIFVDPSPEEGFVPTSEATAEAFGFTDIEESYGFVAYSPGRVGICSSWRLMGWHCSKGIKASVSKIL
jgi:hypothetical protein